jgi:hypothetical protein
LQSPSVSSCKLQAYTPAGFKNEGLNRNGI